MRLIGELEDQQQAQKFAAFLVTEGIKVQLDETTSGSCEVWVKDEDQFKTAVTQLEAFQQNPNSDQYSQSLQKAQQISRAQEKKRRSIQKKIVNVSAGELKRPPRLTILLIGISILVFLGTDFGDSAKTSSLYRALSFTSVQPPESFEIAKANSFDVDNLNIRLASIKKGEIWRLFTPMFVHFGVMHILFNMMWLFQLGGMIERRYGTWRLLILVLFTAAISNLVQCTVPVAWDGSGAFLMKDNSILTMVGGMSGVVYGLLGFVWMMSRYDRSSGFYLSQSLLLFMLGWMFFCMIPGATERIIGTSVANWAHAVGLVVGMIIGYAPIWMQKHFN